MSDPGKRYLLLVSHSACTEKFIFIPSYLSYRSTSEVQAVRKEKDCIKLIEAYALSGELATAEELKVV